MLIKRIIESINGWMKDEMLYDFDLKHCDDINKFVKDYMHCNIKHHVNINMTVVLGFLNCLLSLD